jgi:hypothetical protein
MAYRFTDTEKWKDRWFLELKPVEKLLFYFIVDNCNIAGFIEVNKRIWAAQLNTDMKQIEGALKGLQRGLIYSKCGTVLYVRNFIKHQKNYPINPDNKAHVGILKAFANYTELFEIQSIIDFIEGASKGLQSPTGIGNGISIDVCIDKTEVINTWKTDFEIYKTELQEAFKNILTPEYIAERQTYHPNLNIKLTIEKAIKDYWILEVGWKNKKSAKTETIDWKRTFNNVLTQKMNQVWESKNPKSETDFTVDDFLKTTSR